jgi:hypothetical protein
MSKVFCALLRWPRNEDDIRPDPKYKEGSFGSTGCHSGNLLSEAGFRKGRIRQGDQLAFVQGKRVVFITPEIGSVEKDEKDNVAVHWVSSWESREKRPLKIDYAMKLDLLHAKMINPRIINLEKLGSYLRSYTRPLESSTRFVQDYEKHVSAQFEKYKDDIFVEKSCQTFCNKNDCNRCQRRRLEGVA